MSKKYWFAGVAYDANGHGETVAIHGHTFEEAAAKFYKKYEKLAKDPLAMVDMMTPFYSDEWIEEDGDKDFIPLHTVDTDDSFIGLRHYFINKEDMTQCQKELDSKAQDVIDTFGHESISVPKGFLTWLIQNELNMQGNQEFGNEVYHNVVKLMLKKPKFNDLDVHVD